MLSSVIVCRAVGVRRANGSGGMVDVAGSVALDARRRWMPKTAAPPITKTPISAPMTPPAIAALFEDPPDPPPPPPPPGGALVASPQNESAPAVHPLAVKAKDPTSMPLTRRAADTLLLSLPEMVATAVCDCKVPVTLMLPPDMDPSNGTQLQPLHGDTTCGTSTAMVL